MKMSGITLEKSIELEGDEGGAYKAAICGGISMGVWGQQSTSNSILMMCAFAAAVCLGTAA